MRLMARLMATLGKDFLDPFFFAKARRADEFDFEAIFPGGIFCILTNFVAQRFGTFCVIEHLNGLSALIPAPTTDATIGKHLSLLLFLAALLLVMGRTARDALFFTPFPVSGSPPCGSPTASAIEVGLSPRRADHAAPYQTPVNAYLWRQTNRFTVTARKTSPTLCISRTNHNIPPHTRCRRHTRRPQASRQHTGSCYHRNRPQSRT